MAGNARQDGRPQVSASKWRSGCVVCAAEETQGVDRSAVDRDDLRVAWEAVFSSGTSKEMPLRTGAIGVCLLLLVFASSAPVAAELLGAVESIVISEVELNPDDRDAGKEWVELLNTGDVEIDLAGWTLNYTYRARGEIAISEEALVLASGERYVFTYPRLMLRNADSAKIELRDPNGSIVHQTSSLEDEKNDGQTWQRYDLGADPMFGDLWLLLEGTKGKPNGQPPEN